MNLRTPEFRWLSTCRRRNEPGALRRAGSRRRRGPSQGPATNLWPGTPNTYNNNGPKEAGRGAERLATPNLQWIHYCPVLGLSIQQGWEVGPTKGHPTLVEGSVEGEAAHPHLQRRAATATAIKGQVHFPKKLQTSAQGTTHIYPTRMVGWCGRPDQMQDLSRHRTEGVGRVQAPLLRCRGTSVQILFCSNCGDFFRTERFP
jgi:hypothetical protein